VFHRENFCSASRIKLLYLIDAYLTLAQTQNALALYGVSRSMLELNAFLHEVRSRLVKAAAHAENMWVQAGQEFFGMLIRARFATTRDDFKTVLRKEGVSEERLKPLNVMNCIQGLTQEVSYEDAESRYERLCDFVHHNLASAATATGSTESSEVAVSSSGEVIIIPSGAVVSQYEYPVPKRFEMALAETVTRFLEDVWACVRWIDEMPRSPFPPELLERFTGSPDGFTELRLPSRLSGAPKVGRNEPCPCGSGRKYKYCCGAVSDSLDGRGRYPTGSA
jgi:hypothetical protein